MYERIMKGAFATNTIGTVESNMTMMERVIIKRNGGKWHGNISRNGYGNAIIGRYGGCFEEGICTTAGCC